MPDSDNDFLRRKVNAVDVATRDQVSAFIAECLEKLTDEQLKLLSDKTLSYDFSDIEPGFISVCVRLPVMEELRRRALKTIPE